MKEPKPNPPEQQAASDEPQPPRFAPPDYRPPKSRKRSRPLFPSAASDPDWTFKSE